MTSATAIKAALANILGTLTAIDQTALDNYLPPVETKTVALVIPPFGQQSRADVITTAGSRFAPETQTLLESYRFRCELWVKIDNGRLAHTLKRASDLPMEAIGAILANPTLGGIVDRVGAYGQADNRVVIETETFDRPVQVGGVPYIVIALIVPVIVYAKNEG